MADIPQLIKIGVSLKTTPNNGPVFFKSDGTRFGQTRTIKLLTGTKYKIDVVVKPGAVEAISMTIGGVTFPLEQQSKDPQSVVYTGMYDTEGVAHTKSGERQPVQVNIQFTQAGLFETVWQVKFYNYNKRPLPMGQQLQQYRVRVQTQRHTHTHVDQQRTVPVKEPIVTCERRQSYEDTDAGLDSTLKYESAVPDSVRDVAFPVSDV